MKLKTSLFIRLNKIFNPLIHSLNKLSNYIWFNYPFGKKIMGSKEDYLKLAEETKTNTYPEIDKS